MKKLYQYDQESHILTSYEFSGSVKYVVEDFIREHLGYERLEVYTSSIDEGDRKLYFGENGEIFLQVKTKTKNLGYRPQYNVMAAGHGCEHYYEEHYEYTYERRLLPKDIIEAFHSLFYTVYYNEELLQDIKTCARDYKRYSILEYEKMSLRKAKESLEKLIASYNPEHRNLIFNILSCNYIGNVKEYQITSAKDFEEILEYHPLRFYISSYVCEHDFPTIESFFESLYKRRKDLCDNRERCYLKEFFQSCALTPEWLGYIKEVQEKRYQLLKIPYTPYYCTPYF